MAGSEPYKVLVVDDSALARKVVTIALKATEHVVFTAPSGAHAQKILTSQPIDLVITDILMPDMTGLELASWIREDDALGHVPILFFTSVSDHESIGAAASFGNIDYILKPLRPALLRDRIDRLLGHEEVPVDASRAAPLAVEPTSGVVDLLEGLELPTFSESTTRLIELINRPTASVREYSDTVSADPGLSALVLKLVNSSAMGLRASVSVVHDACALIGMRDLGATCLSASISQEFSESATPILRDLWSHCLRTGDLARRIASVVDPGIESTAAVAGVLHGLGLAAMLSSTRIDFTRVQDRAAAQGTDWLVAEDVCFGVDHCQVSRLICEGLGLPREVSCVVGTVEPMSSIERMDTAVVAVASLILQSDPGAFQFRIDPAADLEIIQQRFPELWTSIGPSLDLLLRDVEEQSRILAVM